MLIPLNFDQRDKARFPHKLGEYCAAGKPIITSNWGEIPNYFRHNENAILLSSADPAELGQRMTELESNSELALSLGNNAYKTAVDRFSYDIFGEKILRFHAEGQ